MVTTILVGILVAVGLGILRLRSGRARALADLQLSWGLPLAHPRRMDAIQASHQARLAIRAPQRALDDRTWTDLDLDAVFAALDRTTSTLGQHALYHRLRCTPTGGHLEAFEALTTRLAEDVALREQAQLALLRLRDPHGYDLWWLARPDAVETSPWYAVFPVLSLATAALLALTPFWPHLVPGLVGALLVNVGVRYLTDRRIGALALAFRQIAPVVTSGAALRAVAGPDVEPLVGALQRDLPRLHRLKGIARWVSGDPLLLPVDVDPFLLLLSDAVGAVYEYLNLAFLLDANGVYFGARALRAHRDALLRVVEAIGEIDSALSIASLRAGRQDWVRPVFVPPGTTARLAGIRHPLLDDPTPNSIDLPPGHGVLVTGSNMSGKSTFLRTAGVTAVLAQTVNTCFAEAYVAPVVRVRSCIGRADDLLSGRSYYIVEVESLLELVIDSRGTEPHLFLLDELFRGTNAVERIAAGQAVLEQLVGNGRSSPHVAIAATHDSELVDLLRETYSAYHFGDEIGADGLRFDHRLRPGPATTRNAIALLRLHGAPDSLIERALATAAAIERQRGDLLERR